MVKRYRLGPRRGREIHIPGQSVQVDVKHLKLGHRRFYQFTAIDEATRYRVLRVYAHNSINSATHFVEEVRRRLPMAIQRSRAWCRSDYRVGVPRPGRWRELVNTDADAYGGSGQGNAGSVWAEPKAWHGRPHSLLLTLPHYAVDDRARYDEVRAALSTPTEAC